MNDELIPKRIRLQKLKTEKKKKTAYSFEHQMEIENLLFSLVKTNTSKRRRVMYLSLLRTYMMVCETGMRRDEIRALKLERIDLDNDLIQIRSVPEINVYIKEGREKNVPISDYLRNFLVNDLKTRNPEEVWYLDKGTGEIAYKYGNRLTDTFAKVLQEHGLLVPGVKPWHGFRARVISKFIEMKGLMHAKEIVGHSQISTIESYVDVDILDLKNGVDLLRIPSKFPVKKIEAENT